MNVIVKAPVIQILAIVFGVTHLSIELLPPVQKTSTYRSFSLKVVTLLLQTLLACLFYQVRVHPNSISHFFILLLAHTQGTNGAIYSLTAAVGYGVAIAKGEQMEVAKENR